MPNDLEEKLDKLKAEIIDTQATEVRFVQKPNSRYVSIEAFLYDKKMGDAKLIYKPILNLYPEKADIIRKTFPEFENVNINSQRKTVQAITITDEMMEGFKEGSKNNSDIKEKNHHLIIDRVKPSNNEVIKRS